MARKTHAEAYGRVNLFLRPVSILSRLGRTEKGLVDGLLHGALLLHSACAGHRASHGLVGLSELLHLVMVAIFETNEALGDLEEVAIWLIGCEVYVEDEVSVRSNLLLSWKHFERVLHELSSYLVEHWEKSPIDCDWEVEFVLQSQLA